jgi:DNA polymerase-1
MAQAPPRVVVVDGTNSLYRAFFAIPPLRAPDGTPTNAAYGFVQMLRKVLRDEQPSRVVVVFDARGRSFRHDLYPEYKAHRDAQPEDLSAQIPIVRELLEAHRVPVLEVEGFEADDVIATLVARAPADARVTIVSTDKDLMQLVDERVTLLDSMKDRRYGPEEVEERFGVPPGRLLDLRSLVGDPSDNIPGVKGIGEKGAAELIRAWGDLDNLLAHVDEVAPRRARSALAAHVEDARLSRRLAALRRDAPLPAGWEDLELRPPDVERLRGLFERLGFARLLEELEKESAGAAPAAAGAPVEVAIVRDAAALGALVEELARQPVAALCDVEGEGGPLRDRPLGIAFALGDARAVYVPFAEAGGEAAGGVRAGEAAERLRGLLGEPGRVAWLAHDSKRAQVLFAELGVELALPCFDASLACQLIDPAGSSGFEAVAQRELGRRLRSFGELAGRGAKAVPAAELPLEALAGWAGERACALRALHAPLCRRLEQDELMRVFEEAELPLTPVLARMERAGVRVDERVLGDLSREYEKQLAAIESEIHALAGGPFLISSPKQLQQVLFERLALPVVKKTKTGYSTDEDVLEQLSIHHELPARILAFRRLAKLKNTYVDALPPLVNPSTGRIHPTFHQLGAATGRLSATAPNVQNIPIRSEEGVRIREAFVAAEGRRLLSADYSQVELRILAHYSQDESLIDAFRRGEDVHRRTAAEIAGIAPEAVSAAQRERAKAVNFGIIYGSSAFGLARQLGIAAGEAQETIDAYFARYAGVRRFLEGAVAEARELGFVRTFLGRRRYLPDLSSRNRALRGAAERMAVNSIIQGTAADLIKRAMVEVDAAIRAARLEARMILQVHDELVFELPPAEVETVRGLVREKMESVLPLRVPLRVDVGVGANWREAH